MLTLSVLLSTTLLSGAVHNEAAAIPPWARRYNVSCSHCHLGANPTLNATGIRFRWAGYRMPEDIGQQEDMKRVSDYIGARAQVRYTYDKVSGEEAAEVDGFSLNEANLYFSGALAKNFGEFIEFAAEEDEFGPEMVSIVTIWGNENSSYGFRFGQQWAYASAGVAGFDRKIGLATPLSFDAPLTGTTDIVFGGLPVGAEAFYVRGSNRFAVSVYNSQIEGVSAKDIGLSNQLLLDELGSALEVAGYYGTQTGVDPVNPVLDSHAWRLGISASKLIGSADRNLYLIGTYLYGNDVDLPTSFPSTSNTGYSYWFSAQYLFPNPTLTLFSRYEYLDPSTSTSSDARGRFVFGGVWPIDPLQYLKLTAEYVNDSPQGTAPTENAFVLEAQLSL